MDVQVWFTRQASAEAERMVRPWYSWPLFILQNLYGAVLVLALLIFGLRLAVISLLAPKPDLLKSALGVAIAGGIVGVFWWGCRREIRKADKTLAEINPVWFTFDTGGLHTTDKKGVRSYAPWSTFDGFREGKSAILLRDAGKSSNFRLVPKNTVPPGDVEHIRSAVRSHLPEIC